MFIDSDPSVVDLKMERDWKREKEDEDIRDVAVAKDGPTDIEDYLTQRRFWLLQKDITGQSANCPWKSARCFCFLVNWKADPMHPTQSR